VPLPPLPIDDVLDSIVAALRSGPSVVLCAPPGAGKTTRVPPALLAAGFGQSGKILVLQPRRVAARATASRMAYEHGSRLGDEFGYQVRFDSKTGPKTKVEVITEGILLRLLHESPFLEGISTVVFDEFHERSLSSDLALGMVRQIQQSVRTDLKLVVMSATLAAEPVAKYLNDCPIIRSDGRLFAVDIRYSPQLERRPIADLALVGIEQVLDQTPGDILVFLPGVGEIRQTSRRIDQLAQEQGLVVHELYGDLPPQQQDSVLRPGRQRKVILSTNVAETSLTIEGVTAVVDSGMARVLRWDESTGLDRLELSPISKASADQRAGRAGRTANGICLRLWPEASHRARPDFETPEIRRVDLAGAVLQVLCWIEPDLEQFPWFEPPPAWAIDRALKLLERLDAVGDRQVNELGRRLAHLPTHPRLARMLLEGERLGAVDRIALAAALIGDRDPFQRDVNDRRPRSATRTSRSDVLERVVALEQFEQHGLSDTAFGPINRNAAKQLFQTRDQLARLVRIKPANSHHIPSSDDSVLRAILAGFPDRVARRREPTSHRALMVGGRGVCLDDSSTVLDDELFVCVDVEASAGEARVRQASAIDRAWLPMSHLRTETQVEFDESQGKLIARRRVLWETLVLEESPAALPVGEALTTALADAAIRNWQLAFPADDSEIGGYVARVRNLQTWIPKLGLPQLDDAQLQSLLPIVAAGKRSLDEVRRGPWLMAIKSLFDYQQLQTVEREAPERIEVPTGNRITLTYELDRPPVLAVRIQEVFGLLDTPRIAGGRIPVLMHLLAPNMRVAQVTDDLRSFWANGYPIVRKDLRARYPKHSWPEDPYTALPQSRPKRKSP
jgi:ATP-dependent helicase HrpB